MVSLETFGNLAKYASHLEREGVISCDPHILRIYIPNKIICLCPLQGAIFAFAEQQISDELTRYTKVICV